MSTDGLVIRRSYGSVSPRRREVVSTVERPRPLVQQAYEENRHSGLRRLKSRSWSSIRRWEKENELLFAMIEDESDWLGSLFPDEIIAPEFFFFSLEDGVLLCKLALLIQEYADKYGEENKMNIPNYTFQFHPRSRTRGQLGQFRARENVTQFLTWCRKHCVPEVILFESNDVVQTDDLREGAREVVICLMEIARRAAKYGVKPPKLILLEKEIEMEERQDECSSPTSVDSGVETENFNDHKKLETVEKMQLNSEDTSEKYTIFDNTDGLSIEIDSSSAVDDNFNNKNSIDINRNTKQDQPNIPQKPQTELDAKVLNLIKEYSVGQITRLKEGKYLILGRIMFIRMLNEHVLVRIGGGWDGLEHYLMTHVKEGLQTQKTPASDNTSLRNGTPTLVLESRLQSRVLSRRENITASTPSLVDINKTAEFRTFTPPLPHSFIARGRDIPSRKSSRVKDTDEADIAKAIRKIETTVSDNISRKTASTSSLNLTPSFSVHRKISRGNMADIELGSQELSQISSDVTNNDETRDSEKDTNHFSESVAEAAQLDADNNKLETTRIESSSDVEITPIKEAAHLLNGHVTSLEGENATCQAASADDYKVHVNKKASEKSPNGNVSNAKKSPAAKKGVSATVDKKTPKSANAKPTKPAASASSKKTVTTAAKPKANISGTPGLKSTSAAKTPSRNPTTSATKSAAAKPSSGKASSAKSDVKTKTNATGSTPKTGKDVPDGASKTSKSTTATKNSVSDQKGSKDGAKAKTAALASKPASKPKAATKSAASSVKSSSTPAKEPASTQKATPKSASKPTSKPSSAPAKSPASKPTTSAAKPSSASPTRSAASSKPTTSSKSASSPKPASATKTASSAKPASATKTASSAKPTSSGKPASSNKLASSTKPASASSSSSSSSKTKPATPSSTKTAKSSSAPAKSPQSASKSEPTSAKSSAATPKKPASAGSKATAAKAKSPPPGSSSVKAKPGAAAKTGTSVKSTTSTAKSTPQTSKTTSAKESKTTKTSKPTESKPAVKANKTASKKADAKPTSKVTSTQKKTTSTTKKQESKTEDDASVKEVLVSVKLPGELEMVEQELSSITVEKTIDSSICETSDAKTEVSASVEHFENETLASGTSEMPSVEQETRVENLESRVQEHEPRDEELESRVVLPEHGLYGEEEQSHIVDDETPEDELKSRVEEHQVRVEGLESPVEESGTNLVATELQNLNNESKSDTTAGLYGTPESAELAMNLEPDANRDSLELESTAIVVDDSFIENEKRLEDDRLTDIPGIVIDPDVGSVVDPGVGSVVDPDVGSVVDPELQETEQQREESPTVTGSVDEEGNEIQVRSHDFEHGEEQNINVTQEVANQFEPESESEQSKYVYEHDHEVEKASNLVEKTFNEDETENEQAGCFDGHEQAEVAFESSDEIIDQAKKADEFEQPLSTGECDNEVDVRPDDTEDVQQNKDDSVQPEHSVQQIQSVDAESLENVLVDSDAGSGLQLEYASEGSKSDSQIRAEDTQQEEPEAAGDYAEEGAGVAASAEGQYDERAMEDAAEGDKVLEQAYSESIEETEDSREACQSEGDGSEDVSTGKFDETKLEALEEITAKCDEDDIREGAIAPTPPETPVPDNIPETAFAEPVVGLEQEEDSSERIVSSDALSELDSLVQEAVEEKTEEVYKKDSESEDDGHSEEVSQLEDTALVPAAETERQSDADIFGVEDQSVSEVGQDQFEATQEQENSDAEENAAFLDDAVGDTVEFQDNLEARLSVQEVDSSSEEPSPVNVDDVKIDTEVIPGDNTQDPQSFEHEETSQNYEAEAQNEFNPEMEDRQKESSNFYESIIEPTADSEVQNEAEFNEKMFGDRYDEEHQFSEELFSEEDVKIDDKIEGHATEQESCKSAEVEDSEHDLLGDVSGKNIDDAENVENASYTGKQDDDTAEQIPAQEEVPSFNDASKSTESADVSQTTDLHTPGKSMESGLETFETLQFSATMDSEQNDAMNFDDSSDYPHQDSEINLDQDSKIDGDLVQDSESSMIVDQDFVLVQDSNVNQDQEQDQESDVISNLIQDSELDLNQYQESDVNVNLHQESELDLNQDQESGVVSNLLQDSELDLNQDQESDVNVNLHQEPELDLNQDQESDVVSNLLQDSELDLNQDQESDVNVNLHKESELDLNQDQESDVVSNLLQDSELDLNQDQESDVNVNLHQEPELDLNQDQESDVNVNLHKESELDLNQDQESDVNVNLHKESELDLNQDQESDVNVNLHQESELHLNQDRDTDVNVNLDRDLERNVNLEQNSEFEEESMNIENDHLHQTVNDADLSVNLSNQHIDMFSHEDVYTPVSDLPEGIASPFAGVSFDQPAETSYDDVEDTSFDGDVLKHAQESLKLAHELEDSHDEQHYTEDNVLKNVEDATEEEPDPMHVESREEIDLFGSQKSEDVASSQYPQQFSDLPEAGVIRPNIVSSPLMSSDSEDSSDDEEDDDEDAANDPSSDIGAPRINVGRGINEFQNETDIRQEFEVNEEFPVESEPHLGGQNDESLAAVTNRAEEETENANRESFNGESFNRESFNGESFNGISSEGSLTVEESEVGNEDDVIPQDSEIASGFSEELSGSEHPNIEMEGNDFQPGQCPGNEENLEDTNCLSQFQNDGDRDESSEPATDGSDFVLLDSPSKESESPSSVVSQSETQGGAEDDELSASQSGSENSPFHHIEMQSQIIADDRAGEEAHDEPSTEENEFGPNECKSEVDEMGLGDCQESVKILTGAEGSCTETSVGCSENPVGLNLVELKTELTSNEEYSHAFGAAAQEMPKFCADSELQFSEHGEYNINTTSESSSMVNSQQVENSFPRYVYDASDDEETY